MSSCRPTSTRLVSTSATSIHAMDGNYWKKHEEKRSRHMKNISYMYEEVHFPWRKEWHDKIRRNVIDGCFPTRKKVNKISWYQGDKLIKQLKDPQIKKFCYIEESLAMRELSHVPDQEGAWIKITLDYKGVIIAFFHVMCHALYQN